MSFIITLDTDWASEAVLYEAIDLLLNYKVKPSIFITHYSKVVESVMKKVDVGLHPYFHHTSSHGKTIEDTVKYVTNLPYNLPAYRCHRFGTCNLSIQAMVNAGMRISSNVCTDLEIVAPFRDRFGILEVPIFFEDGAYLLQKHPLNLTPKFNSLISSTKTKIILIHPMHLVINTPNFEYMYDIKKSMTRKQWNNIGKKDINFLRWKKRGIGNLILELLQTSPKTLALSSLLPE